MKDKLLLLGDEAIALGAINAGLSGVYAYPGTPSTEITEFIQSNSLAKQRGIHSRWCTNEKTAMEAALGMSFAGKRALVCMKHVGMNVAADAFINSAVTGVNGGLVVVAADDPSMHSSQNEQDSRFYGKFAMIPIFEPSSQQEAYDMMKKAFSMSEEIKLPVLLRIVTRLAHSRADVTISEPIAENNINLDVNRSEWVLLPVNAKRQYNKLVDKQALLINNSEKSDFNNFNIADCKKRYKRGIIACGIGYNYVMESMQNVEEEIPLIKVSQYPLPVQMIEKLSEVCEEIIIVEDGQPFVEEQVKAIAPDNVKVSGRLTGALPRVGELNPDFVRKGLGYEVTEGFAKSNIVMPRPPALCMGCGHRDVYNALKTIVAEYKDAKVFGDIGCYTLGALPPFTAIDSCVDMGASITMAKGAADAGVFPAIAVIGDSTFTHSGMTGLLDAVNENANITVIISDNLTTAMTGGQDSAGTNKFEAICLGLGVEREHLHVVVPLPKNMEEIDRILRQEIEYKGVSVIIPRRECVQTLNRKLRKQKAEKQ